MAKKIVKTVLKMIILKLRDELRIMVIFKLIEELRIIMVEFSITIM
jgi:hypothetical protein